jgi:hypothetical protein
VKFEDQGVTAISRQAGAMAEHVADGDLLADPRIGEGKVSFDAPDPGVPGRRAVADQGSNQR